MKKNMGNTDRIIRLSLVLVYLLAFLNGWIEGTMAIVLGCIAVIFFLTSLVNFCPLYSLAGLNTCPRP